MFSTIAEYPFLSWYGISSFCSEDSIDLPYSSLFLLLFEYAHGRQYVSDEDKLPCMLPIAGSTGWILPNLIFVSLRNITSSSSTMTNVPIISWKIRGFHSPLKHTMVFMCLKKCNPAIILFSRNSPNRRVSAVLGVLLGGEGIPFHAHVLL